MSSKTNKLCSTYFKTSAILPLKSAWVDAAISFRILLANRGYHPLLNPNVVEDETLSIELE